MLNTPLWGKNVKYGKIITVSSLPFFIQIKLYLSIIYIVLRKDET